MMRYLLDVNVLLDLLLNRSPWSGDAAIIWDAHQKNRIEALLAAFTLPTIFYVVRRQTDIPTAKLAVTHCINALAIAPVDRQSFRLAQGMSGPDFEDDLQIACAMQAGVNAIVTRDPHGFAASPVPILSPAALVAQIPKTPIP